MSQDTDKVEEVKEATEQEELQIQQMRSPQ